MDANANEGISASPKYSTTVPNNQTSEKDNNGNEGNQKHTAIMNKKPSKSGENSVTKNNSTYIKNNNNNSNNRTDTEKARMNKNNGKTFRNIFGISEYSERGKNRNKSPSHAVDEAIISENRGIFPSEADACGAATAKHDKQDQIVADTKISATDCNDGGKTSTDGAVSGKASNDGKVRGKTSSGETVSEKILKNVKGIEDESDIQQQEVSIGAQMKNEPNEKRSAEIKTPYNEKIETNSQEKCKKSESKKRATQNPLDTKPQKIVQNSSVGKENRTHGEHTRSTDNNTVTMGTINTPFSIRTPITSVLPQNFGAISKTYPYYDTRNKFSGHKNTFSQETLTGNRSVHNKILTDYASDLGTKSYGLQSDYLTNYIDLPALDYPTALISASGEFSGNPYIESAIKNLDIGPISSQGNFNLASYGERNSKIHAASAPVKSKTIKSASMMNSEIKSTPYLKSAIKSTRNTSSTVNSAPIITNSVRSAPNTSGVMKSNQFPNADPEKGLQTQTLTADNSRAVTSPVNISSAKSQEIPVSLSMHLSSEDPPMSLQKVSPHPFFDACIPASLSMPRNSEDPAMSLQKVSPVPFFDACNSIDSSPSPTCSARHEVYGVLNPLFDDKLWPRNSNSSRNFAEHKSAGITTSQTSTIDGTCINILPPGYFYGGTDRSYWEPEKYKNPVFAEYFTGGNKTGTGKSCKDVNYETDFGDGNSKTAEGQNILCSNPVSSILPDSKTIEKYSNIVGMSPNSYYNYLSNMATTHNETNSTIKNILLPELLQSKKTVTNELRSFQTNNTHKNVENPSTKTKQNSSKITQKLIPGQSELMKIADAIPTTGNKRPIEFAEGYQNKYHGNGHKKSHKSMSICDAAHGLENTSRNARGPKQFFDHDREGSDKHRKQRKPERVTVAGLISPGSGELIPPYTPQDLEEELLYPDTYAKGTKIIQNWNAREQDFFLGKPNRKPKFNQCQTSGVSDGRVINGKRCGQEVSSGGPMCQLPHYSLTEADRDKTGRRERNILSSTENTQEAGSFLINASASGNEKMNRDFPENEIADRCGNHYEKKMTRDAELEHSRHFEKRRSLPSDSPINIDNFDRDEYVTFKQRLMHADQDLPRCLRLKPFEPRDESLLNLPLRDPREQLSLGESPTGSKVPGHEQNKGRNQRRLVQRRSSDPQLAWSDTCAPNDSPPKLVASKPQHKRKKKLPKQRSIVYEDDETEKGHESGDILQEIPLETGLKEEAHRGLLSEKNFANKDGVLVCSRSCPDEFSCTSAAPISSKDLASLRTSPTDSIEKKLGTNTCGDSLSEDGDNFEAGFTGMDMGEVNNDSEMEGCDTTISVTNDRYKMRSGNEPQKNSEANHSACEKYFSSSGSLTDTPSCNDRKMTVSVDGNKENQSGALGELLEAEDVRAASHIDDFYADVARAVEAEKCGKCRQSGGEKEELTAAPVKGGLSWNEVSHQPSNKNITGTKEQKYLKKETLLKDDEENQFASLVQGSIKSDPVDFPGKRSGAELRVNSCQDKSGTITMQSAIVAPSNYFVTDEAAPRSASGPGVIKGSEKELAKTDFELQSSSCSIGDDVINESASANSSRTCWELSDNSTESKQSLSLIDRRSKAAEVKDKLKIRIDSSSSMSSLNEDWSETDVVNSLDDSDARTDRRPKTKSGRKDLVEMANTDSSEQHSTWREMNCEFTAKDNLGKQPLENNNRAEVQGKKSSCAMTEKHKNKPANKMDTPYPDSFLDSSREVPAFAITEPFRSSRNSDTLKLEAKSTDETPGNQKTIKEKFKRSLARGSPGLIILENPVSMENFSPVQRRAFSREIIKGMKGEKLTRTNTERRRHLEPAEEIRLEKSVYLRKKAEKKRNWPDRCVMSDSSEEESSGTSSPNENIKEAGHKNADVDLSPGIECYQRAPEKSTGLGKESSGGSSGRANKERMNVAISVSEDDSKDPINHEPDYFLPVPEGRILSRERSTGNAAQSSFGLFPDDESEIIFQTGLHSELEKNSSRVLKPATIQSSIPEIKSSETREEGTKRLGASNTNFSKNMRSKSPNLKLTDVPKLSIDPCCSRDPSPISGATLNSRSHSPGVGRSAEQEIRTRSSRSPAPTLGVSPQTGARNSTSLQSGLPGREKPNALSVRELENKFPQKRLSPRPSSPDEEMRQTEWGLRPDISTTLDSSSRSKSPMVLPSHHCHQRRLSEGNALRDMAKSPVIFKEPNVSRRFSSFDQENTREAKLSPRPSGSFTPRSATPRSAPHKSAPHRSTTPRSVTPRSVTPRSVTPRSVTPRSVTPRSVTPRLTLGQSPPQLKDGIPAPELGWDAHTHDHPSGARQKTHPPSRRRHDGSTLPRRRRSSTSSSSSSESSSDSESSDSSSSVDGSSTESSSDSSSALEDLAHLSLL